MSVFGEPELIEARRIRALSLQVLDDKLRRSPDAEAWKRVVAAGEAAVAQSLKSFHESARADLVAARRTERIAFRLILVLAGGAGVAVWAAAQDPSTKSLPLAVVVGLMIAYGAFFAIGVVDFPRTNTTRAARRDRRALMSTIDAAVAPLGAVEIADEVAQAERDLGVSISSRLHAAADGDALARVLGTRTADNLKAWDHYCAELLADLDAHGSAQPWTQVGLVFLAMLQSRWFAQMSGALEEVEAQFALNVHRAVLR